MTTTTTTNAGQAVKHCDSQPYQYRSETLQKTHTHNNI
jgi:hypothetical protein